MINHMMRTSKQHTTLALDIGGAYIKACYRDPQGNEHAVSRRFVMCQNPDNLTVALEQIINHIPHPINRWLITMTGELCDCFVSRPQGVQCILQAVCAVADEQSVSVWSVDGRFTNVKHALSEPMKVASANWHVLASWVAMSFPEKRLLLLDTGSTTTDLIPVLQGKVCAAGLTDAQRLKHSELIYLGGSITPLMALSGEKALLAMCNEWFSDMHDLAILLGDYPQQDDNHDTPDGQPRTYNASARRLFRMVGQDWDASVSEDDVQEVVVPMLEQATGWLFAGICRLVKQHKPIDALLIAGSGAWLLRRTHRAWMPTMPLIELDQLWDPMLCTCACAAAMLRLDDTGR